MNRECVQTLLQNVNIVSNFYFRKQYTVRKLVYFIFNPIFQVLFYTILIFKKMLSISNLCMCQEKYKKVGLK